jgi:2-keto-4-pentenoate hydratase
MSFDPSAVATALLDARRDRRPAGPLPPAIAPRTEEEGVAAQLALAHRQSAVPPGGFKIGATSKRMQDYLGMTGPAAGFIRAADIHPSGADLAWSDFRTPGVECEIGVRLGRDVSPGAYTAEEAASFVDSLFAAIEIVENRYGPPPAGDLKSVGVPTLIADQVYHAAAVAGPSPGEWRGLHLPSLPGRILVDGEERSNGKCADLLGHPMNVLAWLAGSSLAAAFGGLRAGQLIMLGSVTPPIWLTGPCQVTVVFDGLPPAELRFR